jgi:hypothetical protein
MTKLLPGMYKNRDKRKFAMDHREPMVRMECPGCHWTRTALFSDAERAYRKHLVEMHDFPEVSEDERTNLRHARG